MKHISLLFMFWIGALHNLNAAPLVLQADFKQQSLYDIISVYHDETGRVTQDQLMQPEYQSQFGRLHSDILHIGYSTDPYWLTWTLVNATLQDQDYILHLDAVDLQTIELFNRQALPSGYSAWHRHQAGTALPTAQRSYWFHPHTLRLRLAPGEHQFLLRLGSNEALHFSAHLFTEQAFSGQYLIHVLLTICFVMLAIFSAVVIGTLASYRKSIALWMLTGYSLNSALLYAAAAHLPSLIWSDIAGIDTHIRHFSSLLQSALLVLNTYYVLQSGAKTPYLKLCVITPMLIAVFAGALLFQFESLHRLAGLSLLAIALLSQLATAILLRYLIRLNNRTHRILLYSLCVQLSALICILCIHHGWIRSSLQATTVLGTVMLTHLALLILATLLMRSLQPSRLAEFSEHPLHWGILRHLNHELRGPVSGVIGMTELLQESVLSAKQREYIGIIGSASYALLHQIDELQQMVRLGTHTLPLIQEDFNIQTFINDLQSPFAMMAQHKGLEPIFHRLANTPERVRGYKSLLQYILQSLLDNAIKYTEQGEIQLIVATEDRHRLRFTIKDTGCGMDEQQLETLFDWPQAPIVGHRHAIGLPVAYQLTTYIAGQLSVQSTLRQGSEFSLIVPLTTVTLPHTHHRAEESLAPLNILIVDDNLSCREVLEYQVAQWNLSALSVNNGQRAIASLHDASHRNQPFDIVILDHHMPGMSGLDLAKRIRADKTIDPHLVIIMLTGANIDPKLLSNDRCIQFILQKPVLMPKLKETLLQALQIRSGQL